MIQLARIYDISETKASLTKQDAPNIFVNYLVEKNVLDKSALILIRKSVTDVQLREYKLKYKMEFKLRQLELEKEEKSMQMQLDSEERQKNAVGEKENEREREKQMQMQLK